MEFLRRNAEYFERKALEAFEEKAYGFAVYFAEQALQLYLKYILAKEVGDSPRRISHSSSGLSAGSMNMPRPSTRRTQMSSIYSRTPT
ncbi:MAG: HEPN domain-containing protein [Candidatus Korarchaeum sp.]